MNLKNPPLRFRFLSLPAHGTNPLDGRS
jgi:hypothetical protein